MASGLKTKIQTKSWLVLSLLLEIITSLAIKLKSKVLLKQKNLQSQVFLIQVVMKTHTFIYH